MTTEKQDAHEKFTLRYYERNHFPLAAVRSALADAAYVVDNVAADIVAENTLRNGRITLKGLQMQEALKRASDAVWAMRGKMDPAP